jgi:hypothetical protein
MTKGAIAATMQIITRSRTNMLEIMPGIAHNATISCIGIFVVLQIPFVKTELGLHTKKEP